MIGIYALTDQFMVKLSIKAIILGFFVWRAPIAMGGWTDVAMNSAAVTLVRLLAGNPETL